MGLDGNKDTKGAEKYASVFEDLACELNQTREKHIKRIADAMQEYAKSLQAKSIGEMREVTQTFNRDLNRMGLAIRCPISGRPADLAVDRGSNGEPRFRLVLLEEKGHRSRTRVFHQLMDITFDLVPYVPGLPFNRELRSVHAR